ncbi:carbohydrate ABC transporter permease [Gemmatimonas sp.]|uniref:carbohydrate ABC transporter permease n=1 Tax=Gemmatimonas sp. TaxID=1962908 RepID=UPI00356985B7
MEKGVINLRAMTRDSAATPERRHHPSTIGIALVAPTVGIFLGFAALPVIVVGVTSLADWTGFDLADVQWAGISNYSNLLTDEIFWRAFVNTLIFTVATTVLLNVVGYMLALLVNTRVRGTGLLKFVVFLPVLLSPIIVGLMWSNLLGGAGGGVNVVLMQLGLTDAPIFFLGDPSWALFSIIAATVWQFAGYDMLLFYVGLQSVPKSLVEAATLDGAKWFQLQRYVVIPAMVPVISVVVLLNVIGGLRIFDVVYVMTRGGPNRATEVLATYMYELGFGINLMGPASAVAIVIVALAFVAALVRSRVSLRDE